MPRRRLPRWVRPPRPISVDSVFSAEPAANNSACVPPVDDRYGSPPSDYRLRPSLHRHSSRRDNSDRRTHGNIPLPPAGPRFKPHSIAAT